MVDTLYPVFHFDFHRFIAVNVTFFYITSDFSWYITFPIAIELKKSYFIYDAIHTFKWKILRYLNQLIKMEVR